MDAFLRQLARRPAEDRARVRGAMNRVRETERRRVTASSESDPTTRAARRSPPPQAADRPARGGRPPDQVSATSKSCDSSPRARGSPVREIGKRLGVDAKETNTSTPGAAPPGVELVVDDLGTSA